MARSDRGILWLGPMWSVLFVLTMLGRTMALDMTYCSSQNTGGQFTPDTDMYQSNGLCQGTCRGYAFAVLQYKNCWCTNYAPASTVSTSNCDVQCPGYTEWCGNQDAGLYAYFALGPAVSGTQAGSGSASTASASQPSSSRVQVSSSTAEESSSSLATSSDSARTTSMSSSSPDATSATEVLTSLTTVTGQVRTIFITPTSPSDSTLGRSNSGGRGGIGTGAIVGIVLGVALGLGLLIGAGVWWYLRRKHNMQMEGSVTGSSYRGDGNGIPSRQVSQMSSAGLMGRIPRITTSGLTSGGAPKSADSIAYDRRSLGTDQRLNPYAIYAHEESRHSNLSLQDNQDYSRTLRVANPDH